MSELWIPGLDDTFDATNAYDMMLLFQEQFDKISDPADTDSWKPMAIGALRALGIAIKKMTFDERQINVATEFAVFQSTEDKSLHLEVENVGLRGSIDDVHCCVRLGDSLGPCIALGLDVESIYPIAHPEDGDLVLTTAVTPISKVHYIERVAA